MDRYWQEINRISTLMTSTIERMQENERIIIQNQQQLSNDLYEMNLHFRAIQINLDLLRPPSSPSRPTTTPHPPARQVPLTPLQSLMSLAGGLNVDDFPRREGREQREQLLFEFFLPGDTAATTAFSGLTTEQIQSHTQRKQYDSITTENKPTICPITHEDFSPEEEVIELNACRHIFKPDAILQWLNQHNECPYCRRNVLTGENPAITSNAPTNVPTQQQFAQQLLTQFFINRFRM